MSVVAVSGPYYLQQSGGVLQGSTSPDSGFIDLTWPVSFLPTGPDPSTVFLQTPLLISSTTQYLAVSAGTAAITLDGQGNEVTVEFVTGYPGLVRATQVAPVTVQNFSVLAVGSSIAADGGWVCQAVFGGMGDEFFVTVQNCNSNGNLADNTAAGGIVGQGSTCSIIACYSSGSIGESCGGIAGAGCTSCSLSMCYSLGSTIGGAGGGICGPGCTDCELVNCYSVGAPGGDSAGGIFGASSSGCSAVACYSWGSLIAAQTAGFAGAFVNLSVANSYSIGNIGSTSGGIAQEDGSGGQTLGGLYTSGAGSGVGGIVSGSSVDPSGCYSETNHGSSSGWTDAHAASVLSGIGGAGSTWISTAPNTPYLLGAFASSPYVTPSASVEQGGTTANALSSIAYTTGSGASFALIGAGNGITINASTGQISTTANTPVGAYTLLVFNQQNASTQYWLATFTLTVTAGPAPAPSGPSNSTYFNRFVTTAGTTYTLTANVTVFAPFVISLPVGWTFDGGGFVVTVNGGIGAVFAIVGAPVAGEYTTIENLTLQSADGVQGDGAGAFVDGAPSWVWLLNCAYLGPVLGAGSGGLVGANARYILLDGCRFQGVLLGCRSGGLVGANAAWVYIYQSASEASVAAAGAAGLLGSEAEYVSIFRSSVDASLQRAHTAGVAGPRSSHISVSRLRVCATALCAAAPACLAGAAARCWNGSFRVCASCKPTIALFGADSRGNRTATRA
jgi:hypothetical protein